MVRGCCAYLRKGQYVFLFVTPTHISGITCPRLIAGRGEASCADSFEMMMNDFEDASLLRLNLIDAKSIGVKR
jgi:hypothetical protein